MTPAVAAAAMTQVTDLEGNPRTGATAQGLREDYTSEAARQGDNIMHGSETADEASSPGLNIVMGKCFERIDCSILCIRLKVSFMYAISRPGL